MMEMVQAWGDQLARLHHRLSGFPKYEIMFCDRGHYQAAAESGVTQEMWR